MVTSEFAQHVLVTLVALVAVWVVLRRVFGVFMPSAKQGPGCPSCAAGAAACAPRATAPPADALADKPVPMTLHRPHGTTAPRR